MAASKYLPSCLLVVILMPLSLVSAVFTAPINCSVAPFALPFYNVSILTDPDVPGAHRGIQVWIGSLQKKLSVNVATTINTTFVPDGSKVCNTSALDARRCIFWRGGLFSPGSSTTWHEDDHVIPYNGSASNQGFDALHDDQYQGMEQDPLGNFPRGWDTVTFGTTLATQNVVNYGYPFSIIDNATFPFGNGMLGLASDSRFLDAMVYANLTPTHSWALDYGTTGLYAPGELVVGGYNPSKADFKSFRNYTIFPDKSLACPLQITVKSVKLGSKQLNSKSFAACIEPALWSMVFPLDVQHSFNKTVLDQHKGLKFNQSTWEYFYYQSEDGDFPHDDMTMEFDGGLSVTIPNNELFDASKNLNPKGGWNFIKDQQQAALGTAAFESGVEPIVQLGGPLLSQLYLAVNYESQQFYLAPLNRTTTPSSPSADLKPLGCDNFHAGDSSKSSTGAIVGGAVGGVAGLGLIGALVWFLLRRRRMHAGATKINPDQASQSMLSGYKAQYSGPASNTYEPAPAYQSPGLGGAAKVEAAAGEVYEASGVGIAVSREPTALEAGGREVVAVNSPVELQ